MWGECACRPGNEELAATGARPRSIVLSGVDELTASDYVGHDPANPEPLRGPEGVKEFISTYRAAFPDAQITVEQQLAEGDLVATRWNARGTHEGELMGIQPTGKQVTERVRTPPT